MSSTADGIREFDARELTVADPRGIVLIGDIAQFENPSQRETFQRFRHNLWNPTVMTYDELLNRAKFQVARTAPPEGAPPTGTGRGRVAGAAVPASGRARRPFADPGPGFSIVIGAHS